MEDLPAHLFEYPSFCLHLIFSICFHDTSSQEVKGFLVDLCVTCQRSNLWRICCWCLRCLSDYVDLTLLLQSERHVCWCGFFVFRSSHWTWIELASYQCVCSGCFPVFGSTEPHVINTVVYVGQWLSVIHMVDLLCLHFFFVLFKCWHYTQICFSISEKLQSVSHLECCEGTATATEHLCVGVAAFIDLCSHSNNMISVLIIAIYRHTLREILAYVADWVILLGPPGRQMPDWWTLYTKSNLTFLHFTLNSRVDFLYSIVYMWILHFLQ